MAWRTRARTNALGAPSPPTTVGEQVEWATRVLEAARAPEPRREAAALLATVLEISVVVLEADPAASLAAIHVDRFLAAVAQRTRGGHPCS